jgi:hypothetical protein
MAGLCPGRTVGAQMAGTKPGQSPAMTIKRSVAFHPIFLLGATATKQSPAQDWHRLVMRRIASSLRSAQ